MATAGARDGAPSHEKPCSMPLKSTARLVVLVPFPFLAGVTTLLMLLLAASAEDEEDATVSSTTEIAIDADASGAVVVAANVGCHSRASFNPTNPITIKLTPIANSIKLPA